MYFHDLLGGLGAGLVGGLTSGLLGVSPGGGLVVFAVLLLGAEQHVAQGLSLVAQIPPTSMTGIRRYWEEGSRSPLRWLLLLAIGFVAGGILGAYAATLVSGSALRWTYVAYLVMLDGLLIARGEKRTEADRNGSAKDLHWAALLGMVLGLMIGTDLGARFANKIDRSRLRLTLIFFVSLMAFYMAYKALSH